MLLPTKFILIPQNRFSPWLLVVGHEMFCIEKSIRQLVGSLRLGVD